VAQLFPINQEIVVNENGITGNYRISNVTPDNGSFLYELTNLDNG
jgi:hypothetical protein